MKKLAKILIGIIVLLLIVWLALEPIVLKYLNNKINNIEEYRGNIDDVDIYLFSGRVGVHGLVLETTKQGFTRPFLSLPETRASIDWKSLLKGRLVAKLELDNPSLNFEIEPGKEDNINPEVNWVDEVKNIGVLDLNRLTINNGSVTYLDRSGLKPVDISIKSINLNALNLSTVENKDKLLPSKLTIDAISDGLGRFNINAEANLLKNVPDFDAEISIKNVDLTEYNDAFKEYSKLELQKGKFELYTEIALKDSGLSGYIKPIFLDLSFISLVEKKEDLITEIRQGTAEIIKNVITNKKKQQIATKIPIEGRINQVDGEVWSSILSLLKNAFIEPLSRNIDQSISIKDAFIEVKK